MREPFDRRFILLASGHQAVAHEQGQRGENQRHAQAEGDHRGHGVVLGKDIFQQVNHQQGSGYAAQAKLPHDFPLHRTMLSVVHEDTTGLGDRGKQKVRSHGRLGRVTKDEHQDGRHQ